MRAIDALMLQSARIALVEKACWNDLSETPMAGRDKTDEVATLIALALSQDDSRVNWDAVNQLGAYWSLLDPC